MPQRVRVGAIEMAYEEHGSGGRPFVLVHGFTGSGDDFADVTSELAAHGRTLVPDQRGHGHSSKPGDGYTLDQLTADLAGFLDETGVERCDLLGHSLGGMVALRFALAHPDRLASLVLMDTAARAHVSDRAWGVGFFGKAMRRVPPGLLWRLARASQRRLPEPMRRAAQEMGPERYWERLRVKLEAMDPLAYEALMRAVFFQLPMTERLHEIRCPTTVVVGAEDQAFLQPSRELADGIPDAKLIVIDGAHHSPQIEARDHWVEAIRTHLEDARA